MVSNKKSRSRKKYQYHVNRTKVNRKSRQLPNINCSIIKKEWKVELSAGKNLKMMGLISDLGKVQNENPDTSTLPKKLPSKTNVVSELEKEATAPKNGTMKLPGQQVRWIEYLLDKYGEDYEAMVKDKNNHYQETASQLKQKIKQFKKRPAYLVPYVKTRGLLATSDTVENDV